MSENIVQCPGCQAEYDGAGYEPGDQFECPGCKQIVTVGGEAAAAGKGSAPGKMARMPSRGTTRRSRAGSKPPATRERMTPKMRVVNEAVGMGAMAAGFDPRSARKQSAPPPPQGPDKTMLIVSGVVGGIMLLGGIIFLVKGAGKSEDKDRAKKDAARKAEAKEAEDSKKPIAADTSKPEMPSKDPLLDTDPKVMDHVSQILTLVKGMRGNETFWKMSAPLLDHGKSLMPALCDKLGDEDRDIALSARDIVTRITRWSLDDSFFEDRVKRKVIAAEVWAQWREKAQTLVMPSQAEYLSGTASRGGGDPVKPPDGTAEKPPDSTPRKPPAGGGGGTLARDLPQLLSNYARGTYEEREKAKATVRGFGKSCIPALIGGLSEEDPAHCNSANDMLKEFTKQDFGRPPGEPSERGPFIQKWKDWWTANEASFNM